jgi:hypothetical protein
METHLEEVVSSLNAAGFESVDICVFLPPTHPISAGVRNMKAASVDVSEEAAQTITWLATLGGVVIPGVGRLVGSREYLQALAQSDSRIEDTGRGGVLASLGIPAEAAARYEARVRLDASLVFVSCDGAAGSEWAREILRRLRAEEVRSLGEFDRNGGEENGARSRLVS